MLCRGQLLGIVPKTYLPNYGEFYEKRQFTPGSTEVQTVTVCGQQVPFGTSLLFRCRQMPSFVLGVEPVSYTHLDVYKRQPCVVH